MSTRSFDVYNLEFPYGIDTFAIGNFTFSRAADYPDRIKELGHRANCYDCDVGEVDRQAGIHAVTGSLVAPKTRQTAALDHGTHDPDALDDVILLLSLFTSRDVFVAPAGDRTVTELFADPREYEWGGTLLCSIPFCDQEVPKKCDGWLDGTLGRGNVGFERELVKIYQTIQDSGWQRRYRHGHFLTQAKNAFRVQPIESTFVQCWAIWEHLFALHTDGWLSEKSIRNLSTVEKITFVLVHYGLAEQVDDRICEQMQKLINTRNRLVHVGRLPRDADVKHTMLFIRLTEFVLAKILGLQPSNLFNTIEQLEALKHPSKEPRKREA